VTLEQKLTRLMRPYRIKVIAKLAGISAHTIRNVLRRKNDPSLDTLNGLANALGVEVGWLVDESKGWPPPRVQPASDREELTAGAA